MTRPEQRRVTHRIASHLEVNALLVQARREAMELAPHTTLRLGPVLDDAAVGRLARWLVTGTRRSLASPG